MAGIPGGGLRGERATITVTLTPAQADAVISSIAVAAAREWEEAFSSSAAFGAAERAFKRIHEALRAQAPAE